MPRVAVVTPMPRVEVVDVYDEMARLDELELRVFYLQKLAAGRRWSHEPEFAHDGVLVPELRLRGQLYLNPGLVGRLRRYAPDLTVVTGYYAPAMQAVMIRESLRGRPWVLWSELPGVRFAERPMVRNQWLRDALRETALFWARRFPVEIWAIGSRAQRDYQRRVGGRIGVRNLPYFSNIDRFIAAGERRRPGDRVRFLFCNSMIVRKGFDAVLGAVEILAAEGRDFELHVAGAGPLEAQIDDLGAAARRRVSARGFLELSEIPAQYTGADVLLYPSRHDGWGMGVVEGMAAAMPVISTPMTGAAIDMIEDGVSGAIIDRVEPEAVAAAMRRFIERPGDIAPIGAAAREVARGYDHETGARRFIDAINGALR